MEKKKKNKKRKLGSLLLLLFLTVVMLATSTYAWFTANKTVTISDINVYVATSSGLQISTNATDWKTLILNDDITAGYTLQDGGNTLDDKNQFPTELSPVSTVGTANAGLLNMYKGTVAADMDDGGTFKLTATKETEAKGTTGAFIAFDIFLKTEKAEDLYLQNGSGVTVTDAKADNGLQYASRMAFVIEGNTTATDKPYNMANKFEASDIKILEPNYDGHTANGITNGQLYYTQYGDMSGLTAGKNNAKVAYDGVKDVITTGIALAQTNATNNAEKFQRVTTIELKDDFSNAAETETNKLLYPSFPAGVTKMRVYLWIEGQDIDCENNASGSYLTFNISFTQNA